MRRRYGFGAGVGVFILFLATGSPDPALPESGWNAIGLAVLMGIWWVTECVPIAVTALVPLAVTPLLGLGEGDSISSSYAHPLIFLFLGGFLLSLAMEGSQLHRRIALVTMLLVGRSSRAQVGGVMLVSAFLSMWISNTATAVMMTPIALSLTALNKERGESGGLSVAMLLGVAYGASIGGMATLIGTPPNALLAAYLQDAYGMEIGFGRWMIMGLPFSIALLVFAWFWLTRKLGAADSSLSSRPFLRQQLSSMGGVTAHQRRVGLVFALAALAWVFRAPMVAWSGVDFSDTTVAVIAGIGLFIIPNGEGRGEGLLVWKATQKLPWGILLLFGGGLALASIMQSSGLSEYIGHLFESMRGYNKALFIVVVAFAIVFLTEVTSNTATAAAFLPLLGPIAVSLGFGPAELAIPAALAASCAFMMPVATPPNAIVFASGELRIAQMMRAGIVLNLVSVAAITVLALYLLPLVLE